MLSAAAGGAVSILFTMLRYKKADPPMVINGALAGLVGITAGCAFVTDSAAILIGVICGIVMILVSELLEQWQIDDPVGAFAVHGISGSIGTLALGLFATKDLTAATGQGYYGLFYGGGWELLGIQFAGLIAIAAWGFVLTWLSLKLINRFVRVRVSRDEELVGLDVGIHGVPAYSQANDFLDINELKQNDR
jgi:Amt family ammonium transporter